METHLFNLSKGTQKRPTKGWIELSKVKSKYYTTLSQSNDTI